MKNKEVRSLDFTGKFEIRNDENGSKRIRGYASVFDIPSDNPVWRDGKREIIDRTAFNKTLKESKRIKALYNHNTDKVLGSIEAETLNLRTDNGGLYFEITPSEELRSYENDLIISLERGDISGCSFGFYPVKTHDEIRGDESFRIIDELQLFEISLCPFPAYSATEADYRNKDVFFEDIHEHLNTNDKDNKEDEVRSEPSTTHEDEPVDTPLEQPSSEDDTDMKRSYLLNQLKNINMR